MKVTKQYHQHTPDLIVQLSGDLRAARRLGLTDWTLTSVERDGINYYLEATFPPGEAREEDGERTDAKVRPVCPECSAGRHADCSGDFGGVGAAHALTCHCPYCRAWIDDHGPFSKPANERVA